MRKSFEVLGMEVRILKADLMTNGIAGLFDPSAKTISYDKKLSVEDREHTIIHELMHAVIHRSGLDQVLSREIIEVLCEVTATSFTENFDLKL